MEIVSGHRPNIVELHENYDRERGRAILNTAPLVLIMAEGGAIAATAILGDYHARSLFLNPQFLGLSTAAGFLAGCSLANNVNAHGNLESLARRIGHLRGRDVRTPEDTTDEQHQIEDTLILASNISPNLLSRFTIGRKNLFRTGQRWHLDEEGQAHSFRIFDQILKDRWIAGHQGDIDSLALQIAQQRWLRVTQDLDQDTGYRIYGYQMLGKIGERLFKLDRVSQRS